MLIRAATPQDFDAIGELVSAAFGRRAEADLADRLRLNGDVVLELIADDVGPIVGHVMFSRMTAPFPALGLAPLAVAARSRRRGVATALVRRGLEEAERSGWRGVFVLGNPGYYQRFGFDRELANSFDSPWRSASFMALTFGEAPIHRQGAVDYAPAFAAFR